METVIEGVIAELNCSFAVVVREMFASNIKKNIKNKPQSLRFTTPFYVAHTFNLDKMIIT